MRRRYQWMPRPDGNRWTPKLLAGRTIQARPILPSWVRFQSEFRALMVWLARYGAHTTGFHLAHSPLYAGRLVARSPWGAAKVGEVVFRWVLDLEQAPVRHDAVRRNATAEYMTLGGTSGEAADDRRRCRVGDSGGHCVGAVGAHPRVGPLGGHHRRPGRPGDHP